MGLAAAIAAVLAVLTRTSLGDTLGLGDAVAWSAVRGAAGVTVDEGIGWVSATLLHGAAIAVLAVAILIAWPHAWGSAAPDGSEVPAGS